MSEQIRREFVLNYPIEKVQKAIEDACAASVGSYQIQNRNPAFNSYSISLVRMLSVLPISLQLKKTGEAETAIDLSAVTGPQLSRVPVFAAEMVDGFLGKVGDYVTGNLVIKVKDVSVKEPAKSPAWAIIFVWSIVIVVVAGLIYLISK